MCFTISDYTSFKLIYHKYVLYFLIEHPDAVEMKQNGATITQPPAYSSNDKNKKVYNRFLVGYIQLCKDILDV